MKIHKEGFGIILYTIIAIALIVVTLNYFIPQQSILHYLMYAVLAIVFYLIVQFFRVPIFKIEINENAILCPADGKVVVIEEVEETEYFKDKRLQISVFMSPLNVHVNRYPISGLVKYVKYHPGLYLVAWHPKSSTENERTTIVVEDNKKREVLTRQIAGALAKRIIYYAKENQQIKQGEELGFIKFGSRVDLYLPLGSKVAVNINQVVKGGKTVLAYFE